MAHLLGSQNCLESLAVDISDVQEAIDGIFNRIPVVRFPSWKYPDKASCDLDMAELLDRYCYSKDEEHCKLSHIVLFELLIDRMVLLLQALSSFCNNLLSKTNRNSRPGTAKAVGSAMSVGLVVKKYWNKMAHLYQAIQQELTESTEKTAKVIELENIITDMKQGTKNSPSKAAVKGKSNKKSNLSHTMEKNLESVSSSVEEVTSRKICKEIMTQTYDTAFVPCEACSRTQDNLIEVGKMVMKVCESQGLPSSLAKQKRLLKQSLLAAADVSRWTAEQNRDLSRINDHLDNLYAQIRPLQERLSKSKEKRKVLEEQVKQLEESVEVEKTGAKKMAEDLSKRLNEVKEEKEMVELKSGKEIEHLTKERKVLETKIEETTKELMKSTSKNNQLESEKSQIVSELMKEKCENKQLKVMESELENSKVMIKDMQRSLEKTTLELGKMEAKNTSLVKHDEALQNKHDVLLRRIDELDEECEDLRDKVYDLEGERDELSDTFNKTSNENKSLNEQLTAKQQQLDVIERERQNLACAVERLENDVQQLHENLKESQEKMEMMVSYPSDMNAGHLPQNDLTNPSGISAEMEQQISSNNIRIVMLEAQNKKLRHSIEKLSRLQQEQPAKLKQMDEPTLLWDKQHCNAIKPSSADKRRPKPPSTSRVEQRNNFLRSREKVFEKRQDRGLSAKLAGSSNKVAQQRTHNVAVRTPSDSSTTSYDPTPTFVCDACDKMYTCVKDLNIHKAFCYDLQT